MPFDETPTRRARVLNRRVSGATHTGGTESYPTSNGRYAGEGSRAHKKEHATTSKEGRNYHENKVAAVVDTFRFLPLATVSVFNQESSSASPMVPSHGVPGHDL